MDANTEAVIFFFPIIVSVLATVFFGFTGVYGGQNRKNNFFRASVINLIIFLLAGYLWTGIGDGVGVVVGWWIYGGAFIVLEIIMSIALYFISRRSKPENL